MPNEIFANNPLKMISQVTCPKFTFETTCFYVKWCYFAVSLVEINLIEDMWRIFCFETECLCSLIFIVVVTYKLGIFCPLYL